MSSPNRPQRTTILDTVIIYTTDMDRLVRFYETGLGIGPFLAYGPDHLGTQLEDVYIGFDRVDKLAGNAPGAVTLWFAVDDLDVTFNHLVGMETRVRSQPEKKPWGAYIASVYDPDGNIVGLTQRKENE